MVDLNSFSRPWGRSAYTLPASEPGIPRGNEDARRNENRKSRNKIFSVKTTKKKKHTFFL